MKQAEPACRTGGSPQGRRRAALFGAAGLMAVTLLACEGAEPFYRNGSLGGATGGSGAGMAIMAPLDAGTGGVEPSAPDAGDDGAPTVSAPDAPAAGPEIGCGTCALGVMYWCEGTSANTIRATFSLVNETPQSVPLRELTIRYWFTGAGGVSPWQFACDNGMLGVPPEANTVTGAVTGTFHPVLPPRPGADMYFEVGFGDDPDGGAPPELIPRQQSEFRTRVFRLDYSTITQTDDYSYTPKNTTYGPAPHITLYRNGMLIDGVEPQPR